MIAGEIKRRNIKGDMPYDKAFIGADGNDRLYHATGEKVLIHDKAIDMDIWYAVYDVDGFERI